MSRLHPNFPTRMVADMARRPEIPLAVVGLVLAIGVAWGTARALSWPDEGAPVAPDPLGGRRFQSVLAQLLLRESGLSSREEPLALSAADVNAFLRYQVEVRDAPVWPVQVRLEAEGVQIGGASTLRKLADRGLGLGWALPGALGDYPVWVSVTGQVTVRSGRGEFVADVARVGRQPVPVGVFWTMLGGRPPALTWRMPRVVDRVDAEPGRLVIHTRRTRSGAAAPG